jgi:peptidyl-prolyl cis-trans isomerase B (cyclophilin B)
LKKKRNQIILLLAIITTLSFLGGCKKQEETEKLEGGENMALEQLQPPAKGEEIAVIKTNYGTIKARLFPKIAPKAVENFKTHAKDGYYDGVTFHRVIPDFMIQGGDPEGTGMGGESIWGKAFEDEFDINYRNFRGALSMANGGPNTNGSQFFIVQNNKVEENIISQMTELGEEKGYPEEVVKAYKELGGAFWLDFKHTVFGQVFEGMDVVDKITAVETDKDDKPLEPVVIKKVRIVNY